MPVSRTGENKELVMSLLEELPLKVDHRSLVGWLESQVLPLPPVMKTRSFGGWSILSHRADYRDGFQQSREAPEHPAEDIRATDPYAPDTHVPGFQHDKPTEICQGAIVPVLKELLALGLSLRRARVTMLKPGGASLWHTDDVDRKYSVRLHIPLLTNPGCIFHYRESSHHLRADGSVYMVTVNQEHRIVNEGTTDRYHIIADVLDTRGYSQFHRFDPAVHAYGLK